MDELGAQNNFKNMFQFDRVCSSSSLLFDHLKKSKNKVIFDKNF